MRIFKYRLHPIARQHVVTARGARILSAGLDPQGDLCIWAEVPAPGHEDPRAFSDGPQDEARLVHIVPTGGTPPAGAAFVGTVLHLPHVWHVYAR